MSPSSYEKYKESGVEWLGLVPNEWKVLPLKYTAELVTEKSNQREFPVALENIKGWSGRFIPGTAEYEGEGIGFSTGDILFGKLRPYLAKVWIASRSGEAVGDFHVLRTKRNVDPGFLQYLILTRGFISILDGSTFGAKMPRVSWDFMGKTRIPAPEITEQTQIARFLDHETAKIDALIREQERLIELLQEKRQAVISHAVTKGLDPDVPMKDSGVEWLGEVPAHWEVSRMRFLCRITTGDQDTQDAKPDGQYPFFVRSETIERSNRYCFDGEGVFTSGDGAGVGKIFHYFKGKCAIHQRVYLFHKFTTITGKFFFHFLKSKLEPVVLSQSAKSTVDSLRLPMLQNFWMTCPPDKEQHSICEYLKRFEQESSTLLEECRKSIGLLKERRSALISAAVTGKIDVRGWKPPADESAFAESGTEDIEATV